MDFGEGLRKKSRILWLFRKDDRKGIFWPGWVEQNRKVSRATEAGSCCSSASGSPIHASFGRQLGGEFRSSNFSATIDATVRTEETWSSGGSAADGTFSSVRVRLGRGGMTSGGGVQLSAPAGILADYLGQTAVTLQVASWTRCHPWARRFPLCPVSSGGFRKE